MTIRILSRFAFDKGYLRSTLLSILSAFVLMVGSVIVWNYVNKTVESQRSIDFENLVVLQTDYFQDISKSAVNYLYDLRGNLTVDKMTSEKWRSYIFASGMEQRYPGMFSFSYVERVNKKILDTFIDDLRLLEKSASYATYTVFPKTDNADLYPIKYLYTYNKDISSLLGFDFGSSEIQVSAIREAALNGGASMAALFNIDTVVQNSDESNYVITMPVYSNSGALELTPNERLQFLRGFVSAWIKPQDLFAHVRHENEESVSNLAYTVREGDMEIYSFQKDLGRGNLNVTKEITIYGRNFTVEFSNIEEYLLPNAIKNLSINTLIVLLLINLLWDTTLIVVVLSRSRAQTQADVATRDLIKFRQAVDGVSDLVIITDPNGQILYVNNASIKITGYDKKEILGKNPSLWGGMMDKSFYVNFWRTLKIDKKMFLGEIKNRRKGGEIYESELSVWPILDDKKELIYIVGIERDITKTKAIEKMKTEFISLASHQLRTPLSAVKWFGKMLADGEAGPLSKLQAEYLSKINESNEREIQLVNSLLNVSRIESGRIKVSPKLTDIKLLVESVLGDVKVGVNKEKRKFLVEVSDTLPEVDVDPDLLRHVYLNLLMNAVRYSDTDDTIKLEVTVKDGNLLTKITDSGIGILAAEKDRIFEKFYRGTNALKKETDGSGLGLFLAKSIIESSGGKIWFDSKENVGTTFWFTLPLKGMKKTSGRTSLS